MIGVMSKQLSLDFYWHTVNKETGIIHINECYFITIEGIHNPFSIIYMSSSLATIRNGLHKAFQG
jgi:hypothetical protein